MKYDKPYLTVDEVKEMTHISNETIRKYLRSGKLKGKKKGGHYLIRPEDVVAFVESDEQEEEQEEKK